MAKQLNIDLNFNANTEKAKQAILDLQKSLSDIAKMPGQASGLLFDDKDIKKASQSALELQRHLEKAVNVKTGKLDLSRFSISLKAAGKDLNKYYDNLLKIGPAGQKAFLQMANAVATAETPVVRMGKKLEEMGTVLKNTVRWQISSSILHGFMGSVQSALGYAKNLNESLNNIRIVTGQSADEMSKFAIEANRAAKELSTTTNEYAKASLIYYQQGLSDSDVKARTDITIKMANVARESAETVSDQMTAVWNNFYDGSESLESFADKMTALGAETASSTSEISEGLNKFAGIADTVGLSFDYASAALATVTATSRQSADIVGTAFKTMFARIQGLKLGETLDDGTTLNKYSEALMTAGVNIKDQSGALKDMDTILSEMASKWQTMDKDRQVALAQTVAGTRQYTQLVTLMDNWDFMEKNLETVEESNGALAEQQKIYEEGWEAASDRVRAAAESIYNDLLDDDFFVTILNGFSDVLDAVHGVTEGLGGMKGVAALVGSIFLNLYSKKMPKAMENLRANFMVFTGQSGELMQEVQEKTNHKLETIQKDPHESDSIKVQSKGIEQVSNMQQKLLLTSKNLTEQEKEDYKAKIDNVKAMYEEAAALAKVKEEKDKNFEKTKKSLTKSGTSAIKDTILSYNVAKEESDNIEKKLDKATSGKGSDMDSEQFNAYSRAYDEQRTLVGNLEVELNRLGEAYGLNSKEIQALTQDGEENSNVWKKISDAVNKTADSFVKQVTQVAVLDDTSAALNSQAESWAKMTEEAENGLKMTDEEAQDLKETMLNYLKVIEDIDKNNDLKLFEGEDAKNLEDIKASIKDMPTEEIQNATKQMKEFASSFSDKAHEKMKNIDDELDKLRIQLKKMDFSDDDIKKLEEGAGDSAEAVRRLQVALQNANGAAAEVPKSTFAISEAFSELSSTLMATYSLITTVKSAFETFGDESATSLEKFGAAMSLVMSATSAFSSITQFATSLTKNETVAKWALGKANQAAALTAEELSAATSALSIKIAVVLAIITAVVAIVKALIVTQEEANEKINESVEAYRAEADELQNINNELETTQSRIAELKSKGPLSIMEEAELTKLEQVNAQLQIQSELQEKIAQREAKKANSTIVKNWNTASKLKDFEEAATPGSGYASGGGPGAMANAAYAAALANPENANLPNATPMTEEQRTAWIESNQEIIQENEENYLNYLETAKAAGEEVDREFLEQAKQRITEGRKILYGEEYDDKVLGSAVKNMEGSLSTANFEQNSGWGKALGQDTLDALGIQKDAFDDYVSNAIDKAKDAGITTEQLAKLDGKALQILVQNSEELTNYNGGDLLQFLTGYGYEIPSITTKASELREELEKINKISKDMSVGKIISQDDYSTLVNYNAELKKYFDILSDGSVIFSGDPLDFQQSVDETKQLKLKEMQKVADDNIAFQQSKLDAATNSIISQEEFSQQTGDYSQLGYDSYVRSKASFEQEKIEDVVSAQRQKQSITDEIAFSADDYNERQQLLDDKTINQDAYGKAAEAAMNKEAWEGLNVEEVQEYAEYLEETFGIAEEGSEDVSRAVKKMNRGVEDLSSNWKNWNDILKNSSKNSEEYSKAMEGTKHALSDILDVSEDFIDSDWVASAKNMELIGKAAEGDAEAIDALGKSLAEDIVFDEIDTFDANHIFNIDGIQYNLQEMKNLFSATLDEMYTNLAGAHLNPGDSIDNTSLIEKLNQMVTETGMSVEAANSMYRAMGFTPKFKMIDAVQAESVPITKTYHSRIINDVDDYGNPIDWVDTEHSETEQVSGGELHTALPSMATATADGKMPQIPSPQIETAVYNGGGQMNNHSSSNAGGPPPSGGGGGGSKSKPKKPKPPKEPEREKASRYKEIDDDLKDLERALEKINEQEDRLYGNNRLAAMEKESQLLQQQANLIKQKQQENAKYLAQDKQSVINSAKKAGYELKFDGFGNIDNFTEVENALINRVSAAQDRAYQTEVSLGADGEIKEEEQEIIDKEKENLDREQELLEEFRKNVANYDESNETNKDLEDEALKNKHEQQDLEFEKISYKLELKLELNDMELDKISRQLKRFEGDFFKSAESMALYGDQMKVLVDRQKILGDTIEELNQKRADDKISEADYIEKLKEIREELIQNQEQLIELDRIMRDFYGETLDNAMAEIEKYTKFLDHNVSVLDHYRNVLDLIGASENFEAIDTVLQGKSTALQNNLEVSTNVYNDAIKEVANREKAYRESVDDEARELNKKFWMQAQEKANEAQEKMLQDAEAFMENANQILENANRKSQKALENMMTNGSSFEAMNTQWEHAHSMQEEYLTTTNKIYETDKLINKAEQAIEKSSNKIVQNKLKQFAEETKFLKDKNKLSKFELEVQQKKYDLLLAEIALKEAQEAKDTVRLSRDSEGNFSYVYTANDDNVAEAEQKYADADNSLYNTLLNGANQYGDKAHQYWAEYNEELNKARNAFLIDKTITTQEEYEAKVEEINQRYAEKMATVSDIFKFAMEEDSRLSQDTWQGMQDFMHMVGENWSYDVNGMIDVSQSWQAAMKKHTDEVCGYYLAWKTAMDTIVEPAIGIDLTNIKESTNDTKGATDNLANNGMKNLSDKVNEVTSASTNLKNYITGTLLPAIGEEIGKVSAASTEYAKNASAIQAVINQSEKLIELCEKPIKMKIENPKPPTLPKIEPPPDIPLKWGPVPPIPDIPTPPDKTITITTVYRDVHVSDDEPVPPPPSTNDNSGPVDGGGNISALGDLQRNGNYYKDGAAYDAASHLDTGGYTGEWGPEGKMAVLHEKEIVLNKSDTSNLLKTIAMTDDIVKTISVNAKAAAQGVAFSPAQIRTGGNQNFKQDIHINADFPNATNHNEIEEAFSNLLNEASQYVNRNNY